MTERTSPPEPTFEAESAGPPLYLRQLSPRMVALLEQHFWCDFSGVIPALSWQDETARH